MWGMIRILLLIIIIVRTSFVRYVNYQETTFYPRTRLLEVDKQLLWVQKIGWFSSWLQPWIAGGFRVVNGFTGRGGKRGGSGEDTFWECPIWQKVLRQIIRRKWTYLLSHDWSPINCTKLKDNAGRMGTGDKFLLKIHYFLKKIMQFDRKYSTLTLASQKGI
jgi:hypothetical protein